MSRKKQGSANPPRNAKAIDDGRGVCGGYTLAFVVMLMGLLWLYRLLLSQILNNGSALGFDKDNCLFFSGTIVLLSLSLAVTPTVIRVYEVFPPIDLNESPRENRLPWLFWRWRPIIKDIQTSTSRVEWLLLAFVSYVLTLSTFSVMYWFIAASEEGSFSKSIDAFESFYFSVVTMATVGYGDLYPTCPKSQIVVMCEIFTGLVYAVVVFSIAMDSTKRRERT
ncbi:MAG TPA: potassium channel family protein [Ktedonobacteraceae bacterium]